jgi:hypothetical protein
MHHNQELGDMLDKFRTDILFNYEFYFPGEYDKRNLEIAILQHPNEVFNSFTIFDMYVFADRYLQMLEDTAVSEKYFTLLKKIRSFAKNTLLNVTKNKLHSGFPIVELIEKLFNSPKKPEELANTICVANIDDKTGGNGKPLYSNDKFESLPYYMQAVQHYRTVDKQHGFIDDMIIVKTITEESEVRKIFEMKQNTFNSFAKRQVTIDKKITKVYDETPTSFGNLSTRYK